jgi:hypothetical protein
MRRRRERVLLSSLMHAISRTTIVTLQIRPLLKQNMEDKKAC